MSDTQQLLEQLDARGLMSVCYQRPGSSSFPGEPELVDDVPGKVDSYTGRNVWISAATIGPTAVGRGKAQDTARLQTLPLDIDVKPGGFNSLEDAHTLIDKLAALLKAEPIAIIYTGGGLQPWWKLDPNERQWESKGPEDPHLIELATTVKRWGDLARLVATKNNLGNLDSVFDLARMLRAPDSVNHKYDPPRKVETTFIGSTDTVSYQHLLTILTAAKIDATPATLTTGEVLAAHDTWVYGSQTCAYVTAMVAAWATDKPADLKGNKSGGRHPWLRYNTLRLAAAYRQGCITEDDYTAAVQTLTQRFKETITDPKLGEPRDFNSGEVKGLFTWGRNTVQTDTEVELAKRLGNHSHAQKPLGELAPTDPWLPLRVEKPSVRNPDPVPIDGLPEFVRDMITATAAAAGAPRDVVLAGALGVMAAATRGVWTANIDGQAWDLKCTALWALALSPSGTAKSDGFRPLLKPLEQAEAAIVSQVKKENRARTVKRGTINTELVAATKLEDEQSIARCLDALEKVQPLEVPQYIKDDVTAEALGQQMNLNGGPIALISTEGEQFLTASGGYNQGAARLGLFNRAKDADSFSDGRVGRESTTIRRAVLTWVMAVQPDILRGYSSAATEGSGFLNRFLAFMPQKTGRRVFPLPAIPLDVSQRWGSAITELHNVAWELHKMTTADPDNPLEPVCLRFTPEAGSLLIDLKNQIEGEKQNDLGRYMGLKNWIEKHPTDLARVAAVLALVEDPNTATVEVGHVRAALSMFDGFVNHARAFFDVLRATEYEDTHAKVLAAIAKMGQTTFTTRELHTRVRGQAWVTSVDDVRQVLADLTEGNTDADSGPIRGPIPQVSGGRPSEVWQVHPELLTRGK